MLLGQKVSSARCWEVSAPAQAHICKLCTRWAGAGGLIDRHCPPLAPMFE